MPYSRLIDASPSNLPLKLDSDSKLHSDKTKLNVTDSSDLLPKNSVSDSKLAVDYFTTSVADLKGEVSSVKSETYITEVDLTVGTPQMSKSFNTSESHHSLGGVLTHEEKLLKEVFTVFVSFKMILINMFSIINIKVQRTTSMSSENHSEAFFSADEDVNIASRSSSLRNSILSSGDTFVKQESSSVPPQRCVFELNLCFNTNKKEIL